MKLIILHLDDVVHGDEVQALHGNGLVQDTGIHSDALAAHVVHEQHQLEHELEGIILEDKSAGHATQSHQVPHEIGNIFICWTKFIIH